MTYTLNVAENDLVNSIIWERVKEFSENHSQKYDLLVLEDVRGLGS
jgi:hypothetical protein